MSGIRRLLLTIAIGGSTLGPAAAAIPEWNSARTHAVEIGPQARRLVVGFRATAANAVVKQVQVRALPQRIAFIQAQTSASDVAGLVHRSGVTMAASRQITPSMHVLLLQKTLYGADLDAVLKKLRADPAVQFADVDRRRYAHTAPNDPLFQPTAGATGQWFMQTPSAAILTLGGVATQDLAATDAVSAWSITTGSTGTVIADVDTGVRFDHPDLLRAGFGGRLLPGYDFVDQDYNPQTPYNALGTFLIANDGDGWDPDPSDPGDWISASDLKNPVFPPADCGDPNNNNGPASSSWHGTRVMGVLGAITDNGVGVAGMTWNPYLLPVRALGKCGGYDSDIIAGMQWAAGLPVTDPSGNAVPDNPVPADIINLSLGGTGTCDSTSAYPSVIQKLTGLGVLIVASAGNANGPVDMPGNCAGVLAVAGLRNVGTKVGYSSFGKEVGISAPAGNCVSSSGACYRSIDTTVNEGSTVPAANGYTDQTNPNLGTSFSAPIVAGIAALMRAVNANLTPPQLIARMKSGATPFPANTANIPVCPKTDATSQECSCPNDGTQCGAGMVNALGAVNAALNPIAGITASGNTVFDAAGSLAACKQTISSYKWSGSGGITVVSGANAPQVNVMSSGAAGTLTLTVTDSAGRTDTGTVSFTAAGAATVHTPPSAGTAATACPTPLTFAPTKPTVTEAFSPGSVTTDGAATLTITFHNTNPFALTQSKFTETVPASLTVETSPAPTTTCSGGSGTLTSSSSAVTMAGANIPAGGTCTMTLSVKGAAVGIYTDVIADNALSTGPAGSSAGGASASLAVTAPPPSTGGGGGGGLGWLDVTFAVGVLFAGRRRAFLRSSA